MATIKQIKQQYAEVCGTKKANELFLDIERFEKSLPMGVYINLVRGGIHYIVRTSYATPFSTQVKVSLGTFSKLDDAVKALFGWKIERAMKDINPALANSVTAAVNQINKELLIDKMTGIFLPAAQQTAEIAIDNTHLAILSALPPHEIPVEGDFVVASPFDGTMTKILASTIAVWFKQEEEKANAMAAENYYDSLADEQLPENNQAMTKTVKDK